MFSGLHKTPWLTSANPRRADQTLSFGQIPEKHWRERIRTGAIEGFERLLWHPYANIVLKKNRVPYEPRSSDYGQAM